MTKNPETHPTLPETAVAALYKGMKIEAIKIVRMTRGIGLKEAKDQVEEFIRSQPMIERRMGEIDAEARRAFLPWVIFAAAAAAGLYYFLSG